ncbi:DUF4123 domain-containing protein [Salinivibrio sp. IB872]|uniref:DUF4123 domain-containing protein n=1 Tax=Salinivibrio sp. IB872 TaxID=1766123 RepID=UPI0009877992|nr:DUF4123 domain-containing protein [Salinivibrio sp. IB872]OOF25492.1 hypothetical protein BZJ18_11725 [Salinivibrio sp. IB872]
MTILAHSNLFDSVPDMQPQEGHRLYLMVDGGQIEDMAQQLYGLEGELDIMPVYTQPPYDQLLAVSPFIVRLTDAVWAWFTSLNQPTAGYVFASSQPGLDAAHQLRDFIQVLSPYGSKVFLKLAHSECIDALLSSDFGGFWSLMSALWLPTREGWQVYHAPESAKSVSLPYQLSDPQWSALGKVVWRNQIQSLKQHMQTYFPERLTSQSDPDQWVQTWADTAYQQGFHTGQDLTQFFNVLGFVGEQALDASVHPDISNIVLNPSALTPSQRIEQAALLAKHESEQAESHLSNQQEQL